jgi:hypothetical protein
MNPADDTKLTRRQEQALLALLRRPTICGAAKLAGVDERTVRRWLQLPAFIAAYRACRRQLVEAALGRLQKSAAKAVKALERNLSCGAPSTEIRAALGILDNAIRATETLDQEQRLEELEQRLAQKGMLK